MRRLAIITQASVSRLRAPGSKPCTALRSSIFLVAILVLAMALAGCGGGSSSANQPSSVVVSPTTLSLNLGSVGGISATVVDSTGTAVTSPPTITYTSSNTAVATVSSAGSVCAGIWDANFIVCTPSQSGTANITVTAGSLTATVPVFTHVHVDRVTVSPNTVNCVSSGQTQQLTAKAFSNGVDVTSGVGPFTWTTISTDVATVDINGLVTARTPGQTTAFASISAVASTPATWVTCPVQTIRIHVASATDTSFALSAGGTSQLAADMVDSHGVPVTPPLTWSSSRPAVATVNPSALATAVAAGTTGITASCASACNIGLVAVYSNVVTGAVSGTSATTIYATGTGTTSLVPIDSGTNAPGTAITLPSTPNSFLFSPQGTKAYLGSSAGVIILDATTNTVTQSTGVQGTVLAVSPDSNRIIVAGSNLVTVLGVGSGINTEQASISGATAADFTPDSLGAYILAGSTLYFWTAGNNFRQVPLTGAGNDVKFLANGAFAYVAGGAAGPAVTAHATCNTGLSDSVTTPGVPSFLRSLTDASAVLAADSPVMDVITPTTNLSGCPPPLSDALTSVDLGAGAFTARQLIVLPDGSKAFVTSNLGKLPGLTVAGTTPFAVNLANGASAFTGGSTLDSKMVYVGGSDNSVHRIDTTALNDAQRIGVSFTPDLVAVRPK